jgi:signal peptidase II
MFYFPILKGNFPDWVPFWGGDYFIFFRPVFNIADASISVGVILILLFQGVIFKDTDTKKEGTSDSVDTTTEGSEVK